LEIQVREASMSVRAQKLPAIERDNPIRTSASSGLSRIIYIPAEAASIPSGMGGGGNLSAVVNMPPNMIPTK